MDGEQQPTHIFLPFAVFPTVELLSLIVRQPGDTFLVDVGEKRVGERLCVVSIDDLHLPIDGNDGRHGLRLFACLIENEVLLVGFLEPDGTVQALSPDDAIAVFQELSDVI